MRSRPPISPLTRRERGRRTSLSVIGCSTSVNRPVDGSSGRGRSAAGCCHLAVTQGKTLLFIREGVHEVFTIRLPAWRCRNALEQAARNQLKSIAVQKIKDLRII